MRAQRSMRYPQLPNLKHGSHMSPAQAFLAHHGVHGHADAHMPRPKMCALPSITEPGSASVARVQWGCLKTSPAEPVCPIQPCP